MNKICLGILASVLILEAGMRNVQAKKEMIEINKKLENRISQQIHVDKGHFKVKNFINKLVGKKEVKMIQKSLNNYNQLVDKGIITITKRGTIINNKEDRLTAQGGNITMQKLYWWGVKNYMSHATANKYRQKLKKVYKRAGIFSTVMGVVGTFAGFTPAAIISTCGQIASIISGGISWYVQRAYNKCQAVYKKLPKKLGLVMEYKIWAAISCYRQ